MNLLAMFERISQNGTAPAEGCSLFGVGYEEAFDRLKRKYIVDRFNRGDSAEKFVHGPFGSGKTHFLRQLSEIARESRCVTAEVALNQDIDLTQNLMVYQEVARRIRAPERQPGVPHLLDAALDNVRSFGQQQVMDAEALVHSWVGGLDDGGFELRECGIVLRKTLEARLRGEDAVWETGVRWLSGQFSERDVCKKLGVAIIVKAEHNLYGRRALLSLLQFVRSARFLGTVIGFDEAEQGMSVDKKSMQKILSMLQSGINAVNDLEKGSALIVYAVTSDIIDKMENYPALQQRVSDPGPGLGFFDGNTLAPKIPLTDKRDPLEDLRRIGRSLTSLFYHRLLPNQAGELDEALGFVDQMAADVAKVDSSGSARRELAKRTCAWLLVKHGMQTNSAASAALDAEV